jgi:lipoyl(octanoyl) transferase
MPNKYRGSDEVANLDQGERMAPKPLQIVPLDGLTLYEEAHTLQRGMVSRRVADEIPDSLILLEHPPVITIGNSGSKSDITVKPGVLERRGIAVHKIERGGQVTYHGPGQIVGYTIIDLLAHKMGVEQFINKVEEVLIQTAAKMGLTAFRKKGAPGVYVTEGKIGAIGVRVTRGVTFHGFSFNLSPNLEHYKYIKPCGMTFADITSVEAVTGKAPSTIDGKRLISDAFVQVFDMQRV